MAGGLGWRRKLLQINWFPNSSKPACGGSTAIVGDSLNPVVDAVRRTGGAAEGGIDWIHVRHEEAAAFAAAADAQVTGELAVCAGSCGPGNLHLINGLYDANRSGAPVLAIASHIPAPRSEWATSRRPTRTGCSSSARATPR